MSTSTELPEGLRKRLADELLLGEEVLWTDQPIPMRLAKKNLPIFVFGIIWLSFLSFGFVQLLIREHKSPPVGLLVMLCVFAAMGLFMLLTPYQQYRQARRTLYAITTQRALIITLKFRDKQSVETFFLSRLSDISCTENLQGIGDLVLQPYVLIIEKGENDTSSTLPQPKGFWGIRNVKQVEKLLLELIKASEEKPI